MQTLIQPEVNLKKASFDNSIHQLEEKSNNPEFGLGVKFYQKLFIVFLTSCVFLIFPESPKDAEALCQKYNSTAACIVW